MSRANAGITLSFSCTDLIGLKIRVSTGSVVVASLSKSTPFTGFVDLLISDSRHLQLFRGTPSVNTIASSSSNRRKGRCTAVVAKPCRSAMRR